MFQRLRDSRGITIIETTVILSVLFILAGAMSPIVSESVITARQVKAKNDASMIAMGLINLQKDVGADALAFTAQALAQSVRLPEMLVSNGNEPEVEDPAAAAGADSLNPLVSLGLVQGRGNGNGKGSDERDRARGLRRKWREAGREVLDDHLSTNRRGYRFRRPGESGGWNGPYISAKLKGDPWGNQYLVNSEWFDGGSTAADLNGQPRKAVYVVSAGANGVVETPFEQPIVDAQAYGDDIVVRLQ